VNYNSYRPPNPNYGPKNDKAPAPDLKNIESILAGDLRSQIREPKDLLTPKPNNPNNAPEAQNDKPPLTGDPNANLIFSSHSALLGIRPGAAPKIPGQANREPKKETLPSPPYDPGLYRDAYSRLGLMRLANICDLGCGSGNFTAVMVKNNQRPEVYLGVDISHAQISAAREAYPGWNFIYGDFFQPQVFERYERYDAFLLLNVLDSLEDDLDLLASLPSGKPVLLSAPKFPRPESYRHFPDQPTLKERYGNLLNFRSIGVYRNKDMVYHMAVGERW
jgi:SAM-dependent methyltransferase